MSRPQKHVCTESAVLNELKLLPVTPNDAEANTLTDLVFDDVMTEIER